MNTSSMFKAELRVLHHSINKLVNTYFGAILTFTCVWSQDSKYDHQRFERTVRVAYILLDSESAAEGGVEYWLQSDNLMYVT